jgi:hypothetical protein
MNPLHKIFVAEDDSNGNVVGTTTLLIELNLSIKVCKLAWLHRRRICKKRI